MVDSGQKGRELEYQRELEPNGFVNLWLCAGPFLLCYADGTRPTGPEQRSASLGSLAVGLPVPRLDREGNWIGSRPQSGRWLSGSGSRRRWQVIDDAGQPTVLLCTRMQPNFNAVACLYSELDLPEGLHALRFRAERGLQVWFDGRPRFLWNQEGYKLGQAQGDHFVELGEHPLPAGRHTVLVKSWQSSISGMNGWSFRLQLLGRDGHPLTNARMAVPVADGIELGRLRDQDQTGRAFLQPVAVNPGDTFRVGLPGTAQPRAVRIVPSTGRHRPSSAQNSGTESPPGGWTGTTDSRFGPVPGFWSDSCPELDVEFLGSSGQVRSVQRRRLMVRPSRATGQTAARQIWRAILERDGKSPVMQAARLLAAAAAGESPAKPVRFADPALRFIDERLDCSDFALTWLLRWRWLFGNDPALNRAIDRRLIDFIYLRPDSRPHSMCMGTENHQALFLMLEALAGQRFPRTRFTGSGRLGRWHARKARVELLHWIDEKMRYGYREWGCHYLMVDLECLGMLRDFCDDPELRRAAERLLFKTVVLMTNDAWEGMLAGAQSRAYPEVLLWNPVKRPGADLFGLLGDAAARPTGDPFALGLTTARRPLPEWLGLANSFDRATVLERQGRPGEDTVRTICKIPGGSLASASCPADLRPLSQTMVWTAHLAGGVKVATNHPGPDRVQGEIRPSYWSGTVSVPHLAQAGTVLLCRYDLPVNDPWGFTHACWPIAGFNETREQNGWYFGRAGRGFIGLRPLSTSQLTTEGPYAFQEITASGPCSAWVVQLGEGKSRAEFGRFVRQTAEAELDFTGRRIRYGSPSEGELVLSPDGVFTVNGRAQPIPAELHVSAPWAHSCYGSGVFTVKKPEGWFDL